jgi:hypothetical protein
MAQTKYPEINKEIADGNFSNAEKMIMDIITTNSLSQSEEDSLLFEIERHNRIRKDFTRSSDYILKYIRNYIPEADESKLKIWEEDGSLEYIIIDGDKFYFNRSHTNLFRINKEAKARKDLITEEVKDGLDILLEKIVPEIISDIENRDGIYGSDNKIRLNYKLTVAPNVVPEAEIIKCWMPYPREGDERQKIMSFKSEDKFSIADNSYLQRSVYFEKQAVKDQPTTFGYEFLLSNKAVNFNIIPTTVKVYDKESELYQNYTSERTPHILFTDKIKTLSKGIIGDETNPYIKSKMIFKWISENIPWAGAREYSTIVNISDYCLTNMHGDCGIKTLLFMTLARYNGIPTKWQSGWMLHPGELNLHDWCLAYFEGYGWVPVDQSFGLVDSDIEEEQFFFLGGIDQYRFIVNDDFSSPFSPKKEHPRSETVDFQRGEVEWSGGNLYFDKWNYSMDIEYLRE